MHSCIYLNVFMLTMGFQIISIKACFPKIPITSSASDAFSPVELMHLANFENKLYNYFVETVDKYQDITAIKKYIRDYKDSTIKGTSHLPENMDVWVWATFVASHPFMVFRMIRRIVVELPVIITLLEEQGEIDILNDIVAAKENLKWPTIKDKEDVMLRIIRIQTVYDVNIEKFAEGQLDVADIRLSAANCMEIGRYAATIEKYASAVEWMNIALYKVFNAYDITVSLNEIIVELSIVAKEHDQVLEHLWLRRSGNLDNLWDYDLLQVPVRESDSFSGTRLRHLPQHPEDNMFRVLELCSGGNYQSEKIKSKLHCWYDVKKHPYSHINPIKVELLSQDPYLVQIHDFLGFQGVLNILDETVITLNEFVNSGMSVGKFGNKNVHGERKRRHLPLVLMDDGRVTEEFKDLSTKLECFTGHGRNTCGAERLQVSGYTFGNSDLHLEAPDSFIDLNPTTVGNITSVMIFLNHVEIGGYTAFPHIGIYVQPLIGSALFWSNTFGGEKRDTRLMYSECPVIVGKKWVAKKKIHSAKIF